MHVLHGLEQMADRLETEAGKMVTTVVVYTHYLMFSLSTASSHLHTAVVRHTKIAPHLQAIARNVLANLEGRTMTKVFNCIHLRVEADFGAVLRLGGKGTARSLLSLFFMVDIKTRAAECCQTDAVQVRKRWYSCILRPCSRCTLILACQSM